METRQDLRAYGPETFYGKFKRLNDRSSDNEIRDVLLLLKEKPQGIAEVARKARVSFIAVMDSYYRNRQLHEFHGAILLRRATTAEHAECLLRAPSTLAPWQKRLLAKSEHIVTGDVPISQLGAEYLALDPRTELTAVHRCHIVLPEGEQDFLRIVQSMRDALHMSCKKMFAQTRWAWAWRSIPVAAWIVGQGKAEREYLEDMQHEIQRLYREVDHWFASHQHAVYASELSGKPSTSASDIDAQNRYFWDCLERIRDRVNLVTWRKVKT